MRTMLRGLLCFAALIAALPVFAQAEKLPELLSPADASTVQRLTDRTSYDLRKQLYFAKRYRIVEIDFDLLEKENVTFTITPFDDLSITAKSEETASEASHDHVRHWRGVILDPLPPSFREVPGDDPALKAAVETFTAMDLRIRFQSRDVPPALQEELARSGEAPPRISNSPRGGPRGALGANPRRKANGRS